MVLSKTALAFPIALIATACTSLTNSAGDKEFNQQVFIETRIVHGQCEMPAESVMLNNQSVYNYSILVSKRQASEQLLTYALRSYTWTWIGCTNDGFSYSIKSMSRY